jgi:hypothetical protein
VIAVHNLPFDEGDHGKSAAKGEGSYAKKHKKQLPYLFQLISFIHIDFNSFCILLFVYYSSAYGHFQAKRHPASVKKLKILLAVCQLLKVYLLVICNIVL